MSKTNRGTAAEGTAMTTLVSPSASKIPVGPRGVAPADRPLAVTMTQREWEVLLGFRAKFGSRSEIEDGGFERGQALRKLEAQLSAGGAA